MFHYMFLLVPGGLILQNTSRLRIILLVSSFCNTEKRRSFLDKIRFLDAGFQM